MQFKFFFKYTIISLLCLIFDYFIYYVLVHFSSVNTPIAASVGYFFGLILAYLLMKKKLFKNGWLSKKKMEIVLFFFSGLIGIFCTYSTVYLYTKISTENIHLSKFSAIFVSFFVVFLFRKFVVFRRA